MAFLRQLMSGVGGRGGGGRIRLLLPRHCCSSSSYPPVTSSMIAAVHLHTNTNSNPADVDYERKLAQRITRFLPTQGLYAPTGLCYDPNYGKYFVDEPNRDRQARRLANFALRQEEVEPKMKLVRIVQACYEKDHCLSGVVRRYVILLEALNKDTGEKNFYVTIVRSRKGDKRFPPLVVSSWEKMESLTSAIACTEECC